MGPTKMLNTFPGRKFAKYADFHGQNSAGAQQTSVFDEKLKI